MNNKKLGNIIVEPVEDPKNPGQIYMDSFGWTKHVGVNYYDSLGRFQKGWIPLDVWQLLPDASTAVGAGRWPTTAELEAEAAQLERARGGAK